MKRGYTNGREKGKTSKFIWDLKVVTAPNMPERPGVFQGICSVEHPGERGMSSSKGADYCRVPGVPAKRKIL